VTPPFDIDGGLSLALARAFSTATLMLAFGCILYARVFAPPALPPATKQRLRQFTGWAICSAVLGTLVWLVAQTLDLNLSIGFPDLEAVLAHTMFGHLLGARLVLLVATVVLWDLRRDNIGLACCGVAMALQAGHSHSFAMGGPLWLIVAATLHALAAGAWLGALPALAIVVASQDFRIAQAAAARFSGLAMACVATLLLTAAGQFCLLVQGLPGLFGTAYGWMICAKMAGFAALIALTARNRFRHAPAFSAPSKSRLTRSILAQIAIGLGIVAAAGVLTELQPPMHIQALWPFGWLPSLNAPREDPDIAREVTLYGVVFALGLVCLIAGIILAVRRRKRFAAGSALAGLALAILAIPHFSPLLIDAVPTYFYHSPTGFSTASIDGGKILFAKNCAACHGAQARGDGPIAKNLPIPPANLTEPHLWMHRDGELFWWLSHGIENPEGGLAMPGFGTQLSDADRWSIIDFVRANNAGLSDHKNGTWAMRVHAPDFPLTCGTKTEKLSDLRGTPTRILFSAAPITPADTKTVIIGTAAPTGPTTCHAEDSHIQTAYRIITGADPSAVLVDAHGWLRAFATGTAPLDPKAANQAMPTQGAMPMNMKM
jgi:putative copper export protein/mono/diheme cytochrome c family protein